MNAGYKSLTTSVLAQSQPRHHCCASPRVRATRTSPLLPLFVSLPIMVAQYINRIPVFFFVMCWLFIVGADHLVVLQDQRRPPIDWWSIHFRVEELVPDARASSGSETASRSNDDGRRDDNGDVLPACILNDANQM